MYKKALTSSSGFIMAPSVSASDSLNTKTVKLISINGKGFNLFGYELRKSDGWDTSPDIATGFFGRIGFSSYETHTKGQSGMLYAFAGSTTDIMNYFGTTYYAGVGINLFDIISVEVYLQTIGVGAEINFGPLSIGVDINLIGGNIYYSRIGYQFR